MGTRGFVSRTADGIEMLRFASTAERHRHEGMTDTGNRARRPSGSTQGTTMPTPPGVSRIQTESPSNISLQISRTLRMKAHKMHSDIFLHFGTEPKSDRCFCYFTAAMFVSFRRLRRTQTWRLHTKLYKFGWHASANNTRMKTAETWFLVRLFILIINCIPDIWFNSLNGYEF